MKPQNFDPPFPPFSILQSELQSRLLFNLLRRRKMKNNSDLVRISLTDSLQIPESFCCVNIIRQKNQMYVWVARQQHEKCFSENEEMFSIKATFAYIRRNFPKTNGFALAFNSTMNCFPQATDTNEKC